MLIERMITSDSLPPNLKAAAQSALDEFVNEYGAIRQELYAKADAGDYPISFEEFFQTSSRILGSLEALANSIGQEMVQRAQASKAAAEADYFAAIGLAAVQILIVLTLVWFLQFRSPAGSAS